MRKMCNTLLLLACSAVSSLVLSPTARAGLPSSTMMFVGHPGVRHMTIAMQVETPVKIPDKVPNLAPAKPSSEKANQRGKKFKLLLFNDNVNK